MPLLSSGERNVLIETVRALGRIGDPAAAAPLLQIIGDAAADPQVRLEAVGAIGGAARSRRSATRCSTCSADPSPAIRAAALRSLAAFDRENFITVLSGLDPDPHWNVRAALATVLGTLPPENAPAAPRGDAQRHRSAGHPVRDRRARQAQGAGGGRRCCSSS